MGDTATALATTATARSFVMRDLLARSADRYPDKTAIVHGDLRQTYAELDATVNRTANGSQNAASPRASARRCWPTTRTGSSSPTSRWPSSAPSRADQLHSRPRRGRLHPRPRRGEAP